MQNVNKMRYYRIVHALATVSQRVNQAASATLDTSFPFECDSFSADEAAVVRALHHVTSSLLPRRAHAQWHAEFAAIFKMQVWRIECIMHINVHEYESETLIIKYFNFFR